MNNVITVSQLNTYAKSILEEDALLGDVYVSGELSNYKKHSSGHLYFSLKDTGSAISAAMFKWQAQTLRFAPCDGLRVIAHGRVTIYEPTGQYQLVIQSMQPDGAGALYAQYEKLKAKLGQEGLFSPERKRALPPFPRKIGVITSKTGAAVQDILSILGRRWPIAEIIFCPSAVQGPGAPAQLIAALREVNRNSACDVIIIGRGGGSIEDLWAFNDEGLVRELAASKIPTVSAVGHETDFTLCDFAADLRAPTPSAAAELTTPDCNEMSDHLNVLRRQIIITQTERINKLSLILRTVLRHPYFASPKYQIDVRAQRADLAQRRIENAFAASLAYRKNSLSQAAAKLSAMDPMKVLSRGYSAVYCADNIITSAAAIKSSDKLRLVFKDGEKQCTVD